MAEKTQQSPSRSRLEDYFTYSEDDLQVALDRFMEEQPSSERKNENLWNFQTILGLGDCCVFSAIVQTTSSLICNIIINPAHPGDLQFIDAPIENVV